MGNTKKWKRGDKHPTKELYYWNMCNNKPQWVSEKMLVKLRECAAARTREWRQANREEYNARRRAEHETKKEDVRRYQKEWRQKNLHKRRAQQREYNKKRRQEDPLFLIKGRARGRITKVFRLNKIPKRGTTKQMLGCETWEDLKIHIESQFVDGMSWDNRHEWHVDHRIPLAAGKTEEEIIALCHYTNLQPMWGPDNCSKNDKHCPKELAAYLDDKLLTQEA